MWNRLPVVIRAVISGFLLSAGGTIPWAGLAWLNLRYLVEVPWSVAVMAVYLWYYWKFLKGEGWPRSSSETRRRNCRANSLSDEAWGPAIFAGFMGLIAMVSFQNLLGRMVQLPMHPPEDYSHVPAHTVVVALVMSAIVAGVVEEASFRGYMQGPIERKHGPVVAILLTGIVFGFAHFTHPEVTIVLLPFYMFIAAVYGTIAYMTKSILPGIFLHAGGNVMGAIIEFATGTTEWQASASPRPLIWETGPDLSFMLTAVGFVVLMTLTIIAFMALARVTTLHQ